MLELFRGGSLRGFKCFLSRVKIVAPNIIFLSNTLLANADMKDAYVQVKFYNEVCVSNRWNSVGLALM